MESSNLRLLQSLEEKLTRGVREKIIRKTLMSVNLIRGMPCLKACSLVPLKKDSSIYRWELEESNNSRTRWRLSITSMCDKAVPTRSFSIVNLIEKTYQRAKRGLVSNISTSSKKLNSTHQPQETTWVKAFWTRLPLRFLIKLLSKELKRQIDKKESLLLRV